MKSDTVKSGGRAALWNGAAAAASLRIPRRFFAGASDFGGWSPSMSDFANKWWLHLGMDV